MVKNYLTCAVLRQGGSANNSRDVKFAQKQLYLYIRSHGNQSIDIDGNFGPVTTSFVKEFQRRCGLGQDGVIGAETWKRLGPEVFHGMSYWNADASKKEVQRLLKITGKYTGEIDGQFGAGTVAAVKKYQQDWGLDVDGYWGKQCWGAVEQGCL